MKAGHGRWCRSPHGSHCSLSLLTPVRVCATL
jgi:hypothetical protein